MRGAQPPLGGCVLKRYVLYELNWNTQPAAFRRLCVETVLRRIGCRCLFPAAFRRLCVETNYLQTG